MTCFREDGGVSTYVQDSAWGVSHPDVTAVAGLALSDMRLKRQSTMLRGYCDASFIACLGWPTYWWRSHLYGTWHMLALYRRLGQSIPKAVSAIGVTVESAFDLARAIGILYALQFPKKAIAVPLVTLCQLQSLSGQWPGARHLRVTDPACYTPWLLPASDCYEDMRGTMTTAAVLLVLFQLI